MKKHVWILPSIIAMLLASAIMVKPLKCEEEPEDLIIGDYDDDSGETENGTILQTIADFDSLETFGELLEQAGLTEILDGDGPFTLFIPDDSAFLRLPEKELERMESSDEYLKSILLRHIVKDQKVVFDNEETRSIITAGGEEINAEATEESVQIENARVIDEEIECSNGVIHVIDAVIMPKKVKY